MRAEVREILTTEHKTYYIADDGTEFTSPRACEQYEFEQEKNKHKLKWYPCTALEDIPAKLWYIHSEEEFKWLKKTEWVHSYVNGEFTEEGWYIVPRYDGGDYRDEYDVLFLDAYIRDYERRIQKLKDLTKS
jgi:hypothetical protein